MGPVGSMESATASLAQRAKRPTLRRTIRKIDRRVREYRSLMINWSNDAHAWLDNCQIRVDQLNLVMKLHESWAQLVGLPTTFGEGLAADAWVREHGPPASAASAAGLPLPPVPQCHCVPGAPEEEGRFCIHCIFREDAAREEAARPGLAPLPPCLP